MAVAKIREQAISELGAKTIVKVRNFSIIMDEPKSVGGDNEGPSPCEYMLASLTGCMNAILRGIAKERGLDINKIELEVEGELEIEDQGIKGRERAIFRKITLGVKLQTYIEQNVLLDFIKEAEERCAVSRSFKSQVSVDVKLL